MHLCYYTAIFIILGFVCIHGAVILGAASHIITMTITAAKVVATTYFFRDISRVCALKILQTKLWL